MEDEYMMINVDKLAQNLAVTSWEVDTKLLSERDLWECVVEDGKVIRQIRSQWSISYWNLVENYKLLIMAHCKPE